MSIDKMGDEVFNRYDYEAKITIFFFGIVERGSYEKIVKAYQKIVK